MGVNLFWCLGSWCHRTWSESSFSTWTWRAGNEMCSRPKRKPCDPEMHREYLCRQSWIHVRCVPWPSFLALYASLWLPCHTGTKENQLNDCFVPSPYLGFSHYYSTNNASSRFSFPLCIEASGALRKWASVSVHHRGDTGICMRPFQGPIWKLCHTGMSHHLNRL